MLNVVVLMGRLVADPQLRQTPQGTSVASFRIAVDRNFAASASPVTATLPVRVSSVRPILSTLSHGVSRPSL